MEQTKSIAAAVVTYNTRCEDSPTCRALAELPEENIKVLIYDNSTKEMGNRGYCEEKGWVYLGGTGNLGISKAYNACIDYLQKTEPTDFLCLFDDDTHIDADYFKKLREAIAGGEKILVPLIYAGGKLISPCKLYKGHQVQMFQNEQEAFAYEGDNLSAINSCMAIDLSVFENYRYDENIFLDGVDHYFVTEMKKRGERITAFPYRCDHAFSGVERPSKESALVRFRIYAKDYRYILREDKLSYIKLVGKRGLHLCLQYRTLEFLKAW